jgi:hypothetical protein
MGIRAGLRRSLATPREKRDRNNRLIGAALVPSPNDSLECCRAPPSFRVRP